MLLRLDGLGGGHLGPHLGLDGLGTRLDDGRCGDLLPLRLGGLHSARLLGTRGLGDITHVDRYEELHRLGLRTLHTEHHEGQQPQEQSV